VIILFPGIITTVIASALLYTAQSLALVVLSSSAADLGGKNASVSMTVYSSFLDLGEALGPVVAYNLLGFGLSRSYGAGTVVVATLALLWAISTRLPRSQRTVSIR
jgi:predicted MFS family arabinose efflux permease